MAQRPLSTTCGPERSRTLGIDESRIARVYGGMHFAFSTVAGVELGTRVAQWVAAHHFGRRE